MSTPILGAVEWFPIGNRERVESALEAMRGLGLRHMRLGVSWADWCAPGGEAWYAWLVPRVAAEVEVVVCVSHTPPSLAVAPHASAPPREPRAFADFVDTLITHLGDHFEWVELWDAPNHRLAYDSTHDPGWERFAQMASMAAHWARARGKRTLLGGMSPVDPAWLEAMFGFGVMKHIDAVGIHGFPGTWEPATESWPQQVARVREVLDRHAHPAEVWLSECGYSTWRHDEREQISVFLDALQAPVARVYWRSVLDAPPRSQALDERTRHFGLMDMRGRPKLLAQIWREHGIEGVREAAWLTQDPVFAADEKPVVITGGAGFVGINLAHRILQDGRPVLLLDNLSRGGTYDNLRWLRSVHGEKARILVGDIRNARLVRRALANASGVFHLAAQVAVTTSLVAPREDFDVNALGTLHILEALRERAEDGDRVPLVFTSTNKVYGAMPDVPMEATGPRYRPVDEGIARAGFDEGRALDFHSPYGCSKGSADQYVLDYGRTFQLPHVVLRMSCIYGPHQHGTEDQGWVAHFMLASMRDEPITIYGDGRQVRDVLYVDDLVEAFLLAEKNAERLSGRAFNMGGGPSNTLSLLELVDTIQELQGRKPVIDFAPIRPGDQPYYVSDTRAFEAETGWTPRVPVAEGLRRLQAWLDEAHKHRQLSTTSPAAAPVLAQRGP